MNLHGPVRAPATAGVGTAIVTISLESWQQGDVSATTHGVTVVAPRPGPKPEPVSARLFKTLICPDRRAANPNLRFSPDGSKMLVAAYPSGIVQLWDAANWQEIRRIETVSGYRGSANYAILSPDWSTLYVVSDKSLATRFERDGKQLWKLDFDDEIRRWDLASGKPLPALKLGKNELMEIRPTLDGKSIIASERPPYESREVPHGIVNVYDLASCTARKLADGYGHSIYSPDGKTVALSVSHYRPNSAHLLLLEAGSWKQLARWDAPANRVVYPGAYSPDGKWLALYESVDKGEILHLHILDASTLRHVHAFPSRLNENGSSGFRAALFMPDGKTLIAIESGGRIHLFDLPSKRDEEVFTLPAKFNIWSALLSPDGKTLAVHGQAMVEVKDAPPDDVNPEDLPQPRIFLFDLATRRLAEEIVCPHGLWGGMAFSPDSRTLAAGGCGAVHLFNMKLPAKK